MRLSRIVTGLLSVALLAFMVSDTLAQDEGRRRGGDRGGERGRGGPGGFQGRGGGPGGPGGFQGRGGPGGGRGGDMTMQLLRVDEVKVELQISPDQEEALDKLAEQGRGERPEGIDFRSMSEEERNAFFEKRRKEGEERAAKMKEQLEEILLPPQTERLDQIALQLRGVQALGDEKIAKELKISEDQKKELEEVRNSVQQTMRDRMRELFASGDREAMRDAFGKIREEIEGEILSVLNTDQKKKFEEMKGEPFEMPEGFGRGGFGGRGGPGGGPGGGRGGPGGGRGFGGRGGDGGPGGGDRGGRRRGGRPEAEE